MDVVVRKYEDDDFTKVSKIIEENFSGSKQKIKRPDYITEYVAELDGEVVGYFVLSLITNVVRGSKYYMVDYVCTDVEHQGKGIGKTMMRYAVEKAKLDKVKYIQLTCSAKRCGARHMYESIGFEVYDTNVYRMEIE